ncbi:hypothetical protein TWF679_007075 [Orbilia oligospora]|uniref:Uncharacterized protein n=1 Tax=Orbilia oligospora TaxID=2813651 RepID=A0A8H8VL61_ORBOL|nr:hypothetical protein TWF679_007075 [Orbilia oligospora]
MSKIYSQAYNFGSFIQKGVDPRTGQYTCSISLYKTPASVRNCPAFNLTLSYNPLNNKDIGLGEGWALNLPSYEHGKSKTLLLSSGEHYKIDETPNGLTAKDQKLKNFHFKKRGSDYQVTYKTGQIEILSDRGEASDSAVLTELYAPSGRSLKFSWTDSGDQPRLSKIQEDSQGLLEITYSEHEVKIARAPNTSEETTFILTRSNDRLVEVLLPTEDKLSWKFEYETLGGVACLVSVSSPDGLVEEVQYTGDGHLLPEGAPCRAIPYVVSHTVYPGSQQPHTRTKYEYSAFNFLGYGDGVSWVEGEDNLYRMRHDYLYTSTVQVEDGPRTKYTYNKFHLIVTTEEEQGTKQVIRAVTYHALPETAFHDQPAQFQMPKTVQITYRDTVSGASRVETTQNTFDDWGNPIIDIQPNGIRSECLYYPGDGETDPDTGMVLCPADPHGFRQHIKRKTITAVDARGTPTRSTSYKYQKLPTASGACTNYFVVVKQMDTFEDDECTTSTGYVYLSHPATKDHGRLQQQVSSVSGQQNEKLDWTFRYSNNESLTETLRTTSFDGYIQEEEKSCSLHSGRVIARRSYNNVETSFRYDSIGRLIQEKIAPGTTFEAVRKHEFVVLPGVGYQRTSTDCKGVQTRYIADGLQRLCRLEKRDPTFGDTFRVTQERNYNACGHCIEITDVDWLQTETSVSEQRSRQQLEYDDWGNVCKTTDDGGMVTLSFTDPISLTCTTGIEGEGQVKTKSNIFGSPIQKVLHDKNGTLYSTLEYFYDSLGRLVHEEDSLKNATKYHLDYFDRVAQTIWPDGSTTSTKYVTRSSEALPIAIINDDHTIAEQSFDGLNRVASKTVSGRTTTFTYTDISPEPSKVSTPAGERYDLELEPTLDYAVTQLATSDDTCTILYDNQTAAVLQLKNSFCTKDYKYLPSGPLASETVQIDGKQALSSTMTYSMAGKLKTYTDVHGQQHEIEYDGFGRPQELTQGLLRVMFSYDGSNRLSKIVVYEADSLSLTTLIEYDEFGREVGRTSHKGFNVLQRSSQAYGKTGLVIMRNLDDGEGNNLRREAFQYDSLSRLIDYQCDGSQPPIDEREQGIRRQQFRFDSYHNLRTVVTIFDDGTQNIKDYVPDEKVPSQISRITNTHGSYPASIDLRYNANGYLTRDEENRTLEYNAMGRLSTVRDAQNQIISEYRYDAAGKLVCQRVPGESDKYFYYNGDTLAAVTVGNQKISYVSDGARYWGQTVQHGEEAHSQTWISDPQQSVLCWFDSQEPNHAHYAKYTAYGYGKEGPSIGFNGQWRDPVTGWYHLGNGYRVYNPVLMRFHTPDTWSPFKSGEINPYTYCLGDPINRIDPTGHFSIFGIDFSGRNLFVMGVGLVVGIAVGVLTAGAGFAVAAGVGIAAGAVSDMATGAIYDVATGSVPTAESIGTDALYGAIGGAIGEGIGRGLATGMKGLSRGIDQLLEGAAKLRVAGGARRLGTKGGIRALERAPAAGAEGGQIAERSVWTWAESSAVKKAQLEESHMATYNQFRELVTEQRLHPAVAARQVGDTNYEGLLGKRKGQYTIRLSQEHRVAFTVDKASKHVHVFHLGGHYPA